MTVRKALIEDIPSILDLLSQVLMVHHNGRPDIFKPDVTKYTESELRDIIENPLTPVFVADNQGVVVGYAFCQIQKKENDNILTDIKTLYIDDLCVDEACRGQSIGRELYDYVKEYAISEECYNVTLNVWACNESAIRFYEKCGLIPQKYGMEVILK